MRSFASLAMQHKHLKYSSRKTIVYVEKKTRTKKNKNQKTRTKKTSTKNKNQKKTRNKATSGPDKAGGTCLILNEFATDAAQKLWFQKLDVVSLLK